MNSQQRLRFLEKVLRLTALSVLKRYKPIIVGVTGSVGKSSTKEAIALALSVKFYVRKNEENYNNEIGIPLTIIGAKSGKRSVIGWLRVLVKWISLLLLPSKYPEVLVLELGIDRPGDMAYLLSFLPVRVGVMTNVSSSHLEFFDTVGQIAREKGLLIARLPEDGTAVLCADDERVMRFASKTKAKVITFGLTEAASVRAEHLSFSEDDERPDDCGFKLHFDGKTLPVRLPHVVAEHHVQAVLAGLAVGMAFKVNPVEMAAAVREFRSLPGRMRALEGIKRSRIIDDTYNASPISLLAALKTLQSFTSGRKVVVLGDMLELGVESDESHEKVAQWIREYGVEEVILVGKRMLLAAEALEQSGFPKERMFWFDNPMDAAEKAYEIVREGDTILVKGSQGMRMEKVSEVLLAHPEKASELLCRQSSDWKRKLFIAV